MASNGLVARVRCSGVRAAGVLGWLLGSGRRERMAGLLKGGVGELAAGEDLAHLLVLAAGGLDQMRHGDGATVGGGQERAGQGDVADVAAGEVDLAGEQLEI